MIEENKPKLKAYYFEEPDTGYGRIGWFETAGQAKEYFACENDLNFCDVRVKHVPWADEYKSEEQIPPDVYLAHGWWFECAECGARIMEDDVYETDGCRVYCEVCAEERKAIKN